jgi:DNA polymerase I-like protein with 3'-5' exonuclease and polymerase domains
MVRICTLIEKCCAKDVPLTDKHFNVFSVGYNCGLRILSMRVTKSVINMTKYDNCDSLYNYPVQGTGADGFKLALINLDGQLAGRDARIVHILHNEVIVEARADIVESVAVTVKNCMEKAFNDILPEVPFIVEPEIRDFWG